VTLPTVNKAAEAGVRLCVLRPLVAPEDRVAALQETALERARAERAAQESGERYRTLYNDTPVMLHSIGEDGRLVAVNDHWLKVMGYERSEVLGRLVTEFLATESRPGVLAAIERLRETGEILDHECRLVRRNGEMIDVLVSASARLDEAGRIDHSLAVLTDITARKRAEAALRRSEARLEAAERYRALLEINNAVITNLTQEALFHSVSEALRQVVPFDRAAFTLFQPETGTFRYLGMESQFHSEYFRAGREFERSQSVAAWVFEHAGRRAPRSGNGAPVSQRSPSRGGRYPVRLRGAFDKQGQEHRHTQRGEQDQESILRRGRGFFAGSSESGRAGRREHEVL